MQKTSPMPELKKALLDPKPLPARLLYLFSDLEPEDINELGKLWPELSLERRRYLLQDLTEMAERDNLLDFQAVARLAMKDEDTDVICGGIDLVFESEDKHLINDFLRFLRDDTKSEYVRAAAANALGPWVYQGELEKLDLQRKEEIEDALLAAYNIDPSDLVRRRALESLGFSSREDVLPLISQAIAHENPEWVESALFAMGRSADPRWANDVMEFLDDPRQETRLQAIHAAGALNLTPARPRLLKLLSRKADEEDRKEAIWALAQIGGEGVLEAFTRLQASADDDEELELLEEAVDTLNFTDDAGLYDMMEIGIDEEGNYHMHQDLDGEDEKDPEEDEENHPDYEEWEKYVNEDGEFDDDDDEEAFDNGEFYDEDDDR